MVIEFMGLPGCGKTYLNEYLVKRSDRIQFVDIVERGRNRFLYKVMFKVFKLYTYLNPEYVRLRANLLAILREYKNKSAEFEKVGVEYYVNAILLDVFFYRLFHDSGKVYMLSEGILQEFINLYTNFDVSLEEIRKIYEVIGVNIKAVYIINSVEDSAEAMRIRDRHVCYIDELEGEKLFEFLRKYSHGCEIISQLCDMTRIGKYDDLDNSRSIVMESIKN